MASRDDIAKAIRHRDVQSLVRLFFPAGPTVVGEGFRTETDLWDYKASCPRPGKAHQAAWAELAKDILAFHNVEGGVIYFGIADHTFNFCGASEVLDSKLFNDQIRRFLGDKVWVEYHREFIHSDQRYLGIALIPPRGPGVRRFTSDAPAVDGKRAFSEGDIAIRVGDSSQILRGADAEQFIRNAAMPEVGTQYAVDTEFYRILAPEYSTFVQRAEEGARIEAALKDPRTSVASLIGIGGVGKTALATWATLAAYDRSQFDLIVSITAKDRELTTHGIRALEPPLGSYESLLDEILDVAGFLEVKEEALADKEQSTRQILTDANALLFVDNLETVDDKRIIQFLDDLPIGTRAITTSRRTAVRVATRPIDVGPLTDGEVIRFVHALAQVAPFRHAQELAPAEIARIGDACDRIALAIKWVLARTRRAAEALALAEGIAASKRRGEELLEFTFRRVFDGMTGTERAVLQVLSLFQSPLPTEAVLVGVGTAHQRVSDALASLVEDAVVQQVFDVDKNDYAYVLLPITRAFVYSDVCRRPDLEPAIRKRLTDYFEARDVTDPTQRTVIRDIRQGKTQSELALVDLARAAERRGHDSEAEELYNQALQRNPRSWRAARYYAEYVRHRKRNMGMALSLYERAAANAPARGPDRAIIFREWGMLLRDSGGPGATEAAVDNFRIALHESPNDPIAQHALAHMLSTMGQWREAVGLLERLKEHPNPSTRDRVLPLLLEGYDRLGESVKAAILRAEMNEDE